MTYADGFTLLVWLYQLAAKCDVLVENYMPGKLSEYGLGYEQLHQLNPSLVYASLSGQSAVRDNTTKVNFNIFTCLLYDTDLQRHVKQSKWNIEVCIHASLLHSVTGTTGQRWHFCLTLANLGRYSI